VPYLSNPIGTKNVEKEMRGHMKNEGFWCSQFWIYCQMHEAHLKSLFSC
jgi:hypothetical protein